MAVVWYYGVEGKGIPYPVFTLLHPRAVGDRKKMHLAGGGALATASSRDLVNGRRDGKLLRVMAF